MAHHLEELVYKTNWTNTVLNDMFGSEDLNDLSSYTGLNQPFATLEIANTALGQILNDYITAKGYSGYTLQQTWININRTGDEQKIHHHDEYGYDEREDTTRMSLICYLKLDPGHKPTYLCDNPYQAYEYKPTNIIENDVLIFPSNIYHRAPLNTTDTNRIVLVATFTVEESP